MCHVPLNCREGATPTMPDRHTEVALREVTEETLWSVLRLGVTEAQKKFVASNAVSIAQAHFSDYAWFRAIYSGDTPVGFVMLHVDEVKPEYYLWRFMIDKGYQGKGYGREALSRVIEHVRGLPRAKELFASYVPKENGPGPFYAKLDFQETGELDGSERVIKLAL